MTKIHDSCACCPDSRIEHVGHNEWTSIGSVLENNGSNLKSGMIRYMPPRLKSSRPISPLRRTLRLDELLRRRRLRDSAGSAGLSPLARACRFRMSVKLTTPTKRPESRAPSSAEAGIEWVSGGGTDTPEIEWEPEDVGAKARGGAGWCGAIY